MPKKGGGSRGRGKAIQTGRRGASSRGQGGGDQGGGMIGGTGRAGPGGLGAGGFCICVKCGYRAPHQPGMPCLDERCPNCEVAMVREGSPHHLEIESRRTARDKTS